MSNTPFSSIAWVLGASFFGSFGALFLKMGAGRLKGSLLAVVTSISTQTVTQMVADDRMRARTISTWYTVTRVGLASARSFKAALPT